MQDLTTFLSHHMALSAGIAVLFVLLIIVELLRAKRVNYSITPAKLTQLINHDNAVVVDIRTKDAFRSGHIIDAISMPANENKDLSKRLVKYKNRPLTLIGNNGVESQKVAALLLKEGYNVHSLSGGIRAWVDAQMPLIKE